MLIINLENMKKIFIAIILGILMMSCIENSSESTVEYINIKPGYKVVNANYTGQGTVSILTEKADSNYIPTEKTLTVYLANGTRKFTGNKRYYILIEH